MKPILLVCYKAHFSIYIHKELILWLFEKKHDFGDERENFDQISICITIIKPFFEHPLCMHTMYIA